MTKETWREIPGYDGEYLVSDAGRVFSNLKQKVLKTKKNNRGYVQIGLQKNKRPEYWLLHRIVAIAFIENPDNLPQINHIGEDKENNAARNLEWCTNLYNRHYGTGLERAMRNHDYEEIAYKNRKYVAQQNDSRNTIAVWHGLAAAADAVGGNKDAIRNSIKRGQRSSGYYWSYV